MKKLFLFGAALMMAAISMAQTVTSATVEFKYCTTTYGVADSTISKTDLPFTWNGYTFTESGTGAVTLVNARGCDSILTMTVSAQTKPGSVKTFSLGPNTKVYFAPGNLQYKACNATAGDLTYTAADGSTQLGMWRFADHEWDFVGDGAGNNAPSANQTEWIDLFGFGNSNYNGKVAYQSSANTNDYVCGNDLVGEYAYYDWGVYNPVNYRGKEETGWRTPTLEERKYLWEDRPHAEELYGMCKVNNILGYVFLPDDFELPENCEWHHYPDFSFRPDLYPSWEYPEQLYDEFSTTEAMNNWTAMEEAGAVFLPNAKFRNTGCAIYDAFFYWTTKSGAYTSNYYQASVFDTWGGSLIQNYIGCAVRLVKDVTE